MLKKFGVIALYIFAFIGFFLTSGFFAVKFGLTNDWGVVDEQRDAFLANTATNTATLTPAWSTSDEWIVLREAIIRDQDAIIRAGELANVPPRLIVTQLVVEQLRLFYGNRELFKSVFAPLKILGNQNQFSLGVMGIKQETAVEIEEHLKDTSSPFYLGEEFEHLLDFTTADHDTERFERLINEHDRFYSYLYAALDLRQILTQWKNAGYDISKKPDIVSTLYNIGFSHSRPHANPQSGGSSITINGQDYSFGSLAGEFYNSNLLAREFPRD